MKSLIAFTIFICFISCKDKHTFIGKDVAKQQLKEALTEKKNSQQQFVKMPVDDENEAIVAAEPILFNTYGKDEILSEKHYKAYLMDNYWVINGTLPQGMMGGTFLIIFSIKDGSIIKLTHDK